MVMISGNRIVRESDGDDVDIGHIPIAIVDRRSGSSVSTK